MRPSVLSRRVLGFAAAGVVGLSVLAPGAALAEGVPADQPVITSSAPATTTAPSTTSSAPTTTTAPSTSSGAPATADAEVVAPAVVAAPTGGAYRLVDDEWTALVRGAAESGVEYSLDGGTTWAAFVGRYAGDGVRVGELDAPGGVPLGVQVRNVSGADRSAPTVLDEDAPLDAPSGVATSVSPLAVRVTWAPSAVPSGRAFHYVVWFATPGAPRPNAGIEAPGTATSALVPSPPGQAWDIYVEVVEDGTPWGAASPTVRTATVPGAQLDQVPARSDGVLEGMPSSVVAGEQVLVSGRGFLAYSTVQFTMFSSPVDLGTASASGDGEFSVRLTIPAGTADGTHHLVATGLAPDGSLRNLVVTVQVGRGAAPTLATTGFDAVPVAVGGGLVLLTGAGLLVGARRRSNV